MDQLSLKLPWITFFGVLNGSNQPLTAKSPLRFRSLRTTTYWKWRGSGGWRIMLWLLLPPKGIAMRTSEDSRNSQTILLLLVTDHILQNYTLDPSPRLANSHQRLRTVFSLALPVFLHFVSNIPGWALSSPSSVSCTLPLRSEYNQSGT